MKQTVPRYEERLILAEWGERWVAALGSALYGPRWGTKLRHFRLWRAVYIGTLRGRPRTVTQLAKAVGNPRQTVARMLEQMEKKGEVYRNGRHWYFSDSLLQSEPPALDFLIADLIAVADKLRRVRLDQKHNAMKL